MPDLLSEAAHEPPLQLAIDEACLEAVEAELLGELVRLWEFDRTTVIVGRGSKVAEEVDRDFCTAAGIPILRRCSGGASVVGGAGCLMYSLVFDLRQRPQLRQLDAAHAFVMGALSAALQTALREVHFQGTCDLTWGDRKFSGNSLRVTRHSMLYHGTLLYAADLQTISRCLRMPPRRPDYRRDRGHGDFLTNLPLSRGQLEAAVLRAFDVSDRRQPPPLARAAELCQSRYNNHDWNFRH